MHSSPVNEEDHDDDWRAFINRSWAQDWNDPGEDDYTLQEGKPIHVFQ
jgi:hypothetical protein